MPESTSQLDATKAYRRLLTYVFPYWKRLLLAIICMAIYSATEAGFAALMKPLLDDAINDQNLVAIQYVPIVLIGLFLVRVIVGFLRAYSLAWISGRVVKVLRKEMFNHFLTLPTAHYDQSSSGTMLSKMVYDIDQVNRASTNVIIILVQDTLTAVALIGLMLYQSWQLALAFLIIAPFLAILIGYVSKKFRKISFRLQDSIGGITRISEEVIEGHRVVKTFGGHDVETKNFEKVNEFNRKQRVKMALTSELSLNIIQLIVAFGIAGVIVLATSEAMRDSITPGAFTSILVALLMLMRPIKRITTVNAKLQSGIAASLSIFSFLDVGKEKDTGKHHLADVKGQVVYENVSFTYQNLDKNVLTDIRFTAEPGETLAFVGRSGSGKSTLVNLLARFYDLDTGRILIDGHAISDVTLTTLRNQISLVSQHVTLFNDTIKNNIAYGSLKDASDEEIRRAADMAHASEFINRLPDGWDTIVGENGVLLSGGQRQRLAIARALLKDAPILILDEATSALDTESERYIQSALEKLIIDRTTLVIAHRLSTIENADRILVLDDGRIVEQGSHSELLKLNGHYAALHKMQFKEH